MKILLLQTAVMRDYRIKLFNWFLTNYSCYFIFTNPFEHGDIFTRDNSTTISSSKGFKNIAFILKWCLVSKYDVVITDIESNTTILVATIAKLRGKKIILWGEHWTYPDLHFATPVAVNMLLNILKKIFKRLLSRISLVLADQIVTIGKKSFDHYSTLSSIQKIHCASKYVEKYNDLSDNTKLAQTLESERRKIVLFSGRLMKVKGVEYLIKAFKEVEDEFDNVVLIIVGNGELKSSLVSLAQNLNLRNIIFWDWVSKADLNLFYKYCYVFVQPSIQIDYRYEVNGYSIYECMDFAKPIITTDAVGASPQFVINEYNGFVIKSSDSYELRSAILSLLQNEKLTLQMGIRSKEIYDREISLQGQIDAFKLAIQNLRR